MIPTELIVVVSLALSVLLYACVWSMLFPAQGSKIKSLCRSQRF
jgi:hypothetical protein